MDLGKQDDAVDSATDPVEVPVQVPVQETAQREMTTDEKRSYLQSKLKLLESETLLVKRMLAELPGATEPPPDHQGLWPPVRVATPAEIAASKR